MYERDLTCLCFEPVAGALPLHVVRPAGLEAMLATLPAAQAAFLREGGFTAKQGQLFLLPDGRGVAGAVFGIGQAEGPYVFGSLPAALPTGSVWRLGEGIEDSAALILGYCLGAYRFTALRRARDADQTAKLSLPDHSSFAGTVSAARNAWLGRDLINTPANLLGPQELAATARDALVRLGAHANVICGTELEEMYPAVHAVGRGSARPQAVVVAKWRGSRAADDAPLVSICGKGVCFDTGGYDLKPPGSMLRMKKDMGGAAIALGLARMIVEADLDLRLELRLGCVENMVSGDAMRPLDVLKTRKGLTVEVGNTDAEGRLVLCDLLAEACEAEPSLLIDFATLTGAARVALGPDLPAMFSNDDGLANLFLQAGHAAHDPVWRLPLWDGYNYWLESDVSDVINVSDKTHAGAIVAALFLQRFVSEGTRWVHFDVYGWNDAARAGRPAGGEVQAMRAVFGGVVRFLQERAAE